MSKFVKLSEGSIWNLDAIECITEPNVDGLAYVSFCGVSGDSLAVAGPTGRELYSALADREGGEVSDHDNLPEAMGELLYLRGQMNLLRAEIERLNEVNRLAYERNARLDEKLNQAMLDHIALRKENTQLREENVMLVESRKSADIAVVKLAQEVAVQRADGDRLREAIKREANRHSTRICYLGGVLIECSCEICRIAREGK